MYFPVEAAGGPGKRTRGMTGSDHSRTIAARAAVIAEQLHHECSILLETYRKKESFTVDVAVDVAVDDSRLVSVPPPSSQLDTRDKLRHLHSALLQCRSLLDRAIAKEEEELGSEKKGEYENQRKMVKERLSLLLDNTGELFKAANCTEMLTPSLELDGPSIVFELKLWVYRIFKEVDHWTKTTITTLQDMPIVTTKGPARTTMSVWSTRR